MAATDCNWLAALPTIQVETAALTKQKCHYELNHVCMYTLL